MRRHAPITAESGVLFYTDVDTGISNVALTGGAPGQIATSNVVNIAGFRRLTAIWIFQVAALVPTIQARVQLLREDLATVVITENMHAAATNVAGVYHYTSMLGAGFAAGTYPGLDTPPHAIPAIKILLANAAAAGNNASGVYLYVTVDYGSRAN